MSFKDSVVSWYIQYIIGPKMQNIDSPGFIITSVGGKGKETYRRSLLIEEDLLSTIEEHIIEAYGDGGRQALYSAGKKFGYNYASLSNFTQFKNNEPEFLKFVYFLNRYITTMYATAADYTVDVSRKTFTIQLKDYFVCSKDGIGYIMADGGIAGIWAYMMNDKTIEGVQTKCQGRKDKLCMVVAGSRVELDKRGLKYLKENNIEELKFDEQYKKLNMERKTEFSQSSLRDLIDSKFFSYDKSFIRHKEMKYAMVDSNIVYIIENEITKLPGGVQKLFDACFEHGKLLQVKYGDRNYRKFITDYFSALGWGDILVLEGKSGPSVTVNYYPWSIYSEKAEYIIFRGVLSGFISSCLGKKVVFDKYSSKIGDCLSITMK